MDQKPKNNMFIAILFAVFAVPFAAWAIYEEIKNPGSGARETQSYNPCTDSSSAIVAAEELVRKQLMAPSTAKFPGMFDDPPKVQSLGVCRRRVISYVDAQNAFGAMLRSKYQADIEYSPSTNRWTLVDLKM